MSKSRVIILDWTELAPSGHHRGKQPGNAGRRGRNARQGSSGDEPDFRHAKHRLPNGTQRIGALLFLPSKDATGWVI